tara:strand:- start:17829 stop:19232 length:1404 start_codon:yes stop_codon:yes gene_type:complete
MTEPVSHNVGSARLGADENATGEASPLTINSSKLPKPADVPKADRPLKICLVYSRTPLPMRRADQMTVAHLLAFLHARGHQVDFFYVDTGSEPTQSDREWIADNTREAYQFKLDAWSILCGLTRVATRFLPFQVGLFSHPGQMRSVRAAVASQDYDIVYTYYFRSAEITKDIGFEPSVPKSRRKGRPATFLAFQLSQTLNATRIAKNAPDLKNKIFYEIESRLVRYYEARIWRHFTRTVLIGKSDVEEIKKACRHSGVAEIDNYVYGAHGTDVGRFKPQSDVAIKPDHLVFSGVMRTPTNVQAVQWFVKNVWPLIRAKRPTATFAIVGREPTSDIKELAKLPGIVVTGAVPDTAAFIAEASVCINPMQAGGGMQNKLIEFMACGKPVVATSVANEGIGAPADCLMSADTPQDFARAVLDLFGDQRRAGEMGQRARAYVRSHWTWEAHYLKLEQNFYDALDNEVFSVS